MIQRQNLVWFCISYGDIKMIEELPRDCCTDMDLLPLYNDKDVIRAVKCMICNKEYKVTKKLCDRRVN